ncbi:LuxR C-terminal-related transcriptional regulator [Streptomyces sp. YS-3]|uniref:helix-turn-helix transcriptional regulator n=1 Tax=Streptomyces sp. YS-3 TaxID=3381352 RepID=UPI003862286C
MTEAERPPGWQPSGRGGKDGPPYEEFGVVPVAGVRDAQVGTAMPVGREAEAERILAALDVRTGPSRSLLLLGAPGTGKTRLLRFAEESAAALGLRVLSVRGWGTQEPRPYASLHRLLGPVLDGADGPPAVSGPQEPPALCALVPALLSGMGPVLLAVDDAEECDPDSLDVLFRLRRRLMDRAVTLLFTATGEVPPAGTPVDLPVLPLGPLSPRAAAELLEARPDAPVGRPRLEVLRQAEGNPLALVELSRALRPTGTAGRTARIQQLFAARLDALPRRTRHALLYAATALPQEELPVVMAALGSEDLGLWTPAEEAGLIAVAGGRLVFGDPLARTAAYHRHSARARQDAHRDLAAAPGQLPARRARHLAAAAIGPDETVAAALEDAAGQTADRFEAATALEQAALLSATDEDRARRLAAAMATAGDLGDPEWVRELYAEFTRVNRDPELRCAAACSMAGALTLLSFQREAFGLLLDVWRGSPPRTATTAFALTALAAAIAHQSGLPEHRRELPHLLDHARRVASRDERGERSATADRDVFPELAAPEILTALETYLTVGLALDPEVPADAVARRTADPFTGPVDGVGPLARLLAGAAAAYYTDDSELCAEMYRRASTPHGVRGPCGSPVWTLPAQVDALISMARWDEAAALIAQGRTEAAVHRLPRIDMDLEALDVTLRALRGDSVPELPFTGPHWRSVNLGENGATRARMLRACGLAALASGDADRAYRHLRALFAEDGSPLAPFLSPRSISELAAAAQRADRKEEAARVLAAVRARQGERPTTRMTLLMHHAAALVDETSDPEDHFRLALVNPEGDTWPLERARARLHYAIWLRRRRRPREARAQLTAVLEIAARIGARGLADSARGELRATGVAEAPAAAASDRLGELTAQQRQIARLAAYGLSNREIGDRLFLSPRTVGSHLYNVYPKLGISSRHQLRDLLHDS